MPAAKLRLNDRGLIRPGLAADLVIFDPAEVSDKATYDNPHQYAGGIFHVIVNGNLVIHENNLPRHGPTGCLSPAINIRTRPAALSWRQPCRLTFRHRDPAYLPKN